jgi:predicted RND superfamily exporter protein
MFFAFTVLLFSTGNVIQAVISILCVGVIVISVLSIMVLKEWELGTIESISVVITIGFSVDYVIHLSNDYMHSTADSRHNKMK